MKKFASVVFAFLILVTIFQSNSVFAANEDFEPNSNETKNELALSNNIYNKLHFYLDVDEYGTIDSQDELEKATNYAVNEFAVKQNDYLNSRGEEFASYQVTIEFSSEFMNTDKYKELMKERETMSTVEEIHDFRFRLNSYSKEYHSALVQKSVKSLKELEYTEVSPISYSPFVVLETPVKNLTVNSLTSLAKRTDIMHISIATVEESENEKPPIEIPFDDPIPFSDPNSWENALREINAYDIVTNGTLTGESIRIGILESIGVCDTTNSWLSNIDITTHANHSVDGHATLVTLVVSQIAPDAKYFCSKKVSGRWLEWFLDNCCDVVNYSAGNDTNEYTYNSDAIIDYQVMAHRITFVKSAGNRNEGDTDIEITSPGYAFNAITVGGVYVNSLGNLIHYPTSCYASNYPTNKPNVAGINKIVELPNHTGNSVVTGTSVSAPQVTGCIALLMQHNPRLIDKPEVIMSLIASNARETDDYVANSDTSLDDKVGAGVIDLGRMIANSNYYSICNLTGEDGDDIYSFDLYLTAGSEIQIAIAWLAGTNGSILGNNISVSEIYLTDYVLFLELCDPDFASGSVVEAYSSAMDSNVQMIRCNITVSGTYRISIAQFSDIHPNMNGDDIAFTYNVE